MINIAKRMMQKEKQNILRTGKPGLIAYLEQCGEKPFRAKQIEQWLWEKGIRSIDEMLNISKDLREKLEQQFYLSRSGINQIKEDGDGTAKIAFNLEDQQIVEGVYIPSGKRVTACVSSQTGCKLNCSFCATARLKNCRDLYADEIFEQVYTIKEMAEKKGKQLTNIVYMGMGEPLLNYTEVMKSIQRVTGSPGLSMSPSRITVSTVGIIPGIEQMANDKVRFNLAISLHSAIEKTRTSLLPINRKYPLEQLSDAIVGFHKATGKRVTLEYLMLDGVNDNREEALALAGYCKAFPVKINLIEYNNVEDSDFKGSDEKKINRFKEILESKNMVVNIRRSRGKKIHAACGQLANKNINKTKN